MGRIYYNKLIRDKIPQVIEQAGSECETYTLDQKQFEEALLKKVEEEASALPECTSREETISELADVLDVIDEIKRLKEITDDELHAAQQKNFVKKGGFDKQLFLVWSSDDDYKTNEKRNAK